MLWVDYAILAIIAVSATIGLFRGFFREALGLATWVLAFWLAFRLAEFGGGLLAEWVSVRSVRLAIAFGTVFVLVLMVGAVANFLIGKLIVQTGFAGTDRILGGVFGVLRGIAILVLLVLLAGLTPVPGDAWWRQSLFIGHLQTGALWVRGWLPADVADAIEYSQPQGEPEAGVSEPSPAGG
jgi:membrane protein required for colicin V production